jgi:hypothetical protein
MCARLQPMHGGGYLVKICTVDRGASRGGPPKYGPRALGARRVYLDFASNNGTLWAIDFAAPYGHCREVVRALRECFPRGTKFRIYRTEQNRFGWVVA